VISRFGAGWLDGLKCLAPAQSDFSKDVHFVQDGRGAGTPAATPTFLASLAGDGDQGALAGASVYSVKLEALLAAQHAVHNC
jgi:hypothetical protein